MNQSRVIINGLNEAHGVMKRALLELKIDEGKQAFLAAGPDYFLGLMESNGQDGVVRSLGRIWAISRETDPLMHEHAQEVLETVARSGPDASLLEDCPICDQPALKTFECLECGFSFIEDYCCPYLTESNRQCRKANKACNLFGLEFETCEVFV